jgi:outer membrane biosynthesis protein TonB
MTVQDGLDVPVNAGKHKIRIVGPVNACDTIVSLEGGKTTTLDCVLAPAAGSAAAVQTGSGSAAVAQAPEVKTPETPEVKAPEVKTPEVKTPEVKTPEVKSPEVKTPEVPETKGSTSTKTPEVKTETVKTKTPETTKAVAKAPETHTSKTPETHAAATKTPETTKTDSGAADPSKGYLQVFSKPVAKILVDGVDSGMKTPISGHTLALSPGKHKVTFVIGDDRFTYPVTIKQGSTETMSKDLQ